MSQAQNAYQLWAVFFPAVFNTCLGARPAAGVWPLVSSDKRRDAQLETETAPEGVRSFLRILVMAPPVDVGELP